MTPFLHYSWRFLQYLTYPAGWRQLGREAYRRWFLFRSSVRFRAWVRFRKAVGLPCGNAVPYSQFETVARDSLDHHHPKGALLNLTNRGFLLRMNDEFAAYPKFLDMGCGGGQLVRDAYQLGWDVAGVDGCGAAKLNKPYLHRVDITQRFSFQKKFTLITAWEVLEHIPAGRLWAVFRNVVDNLESGGLFLASTNSEPDIHEGVDLHETKWSNAQWKEWIRVNVPELEPIDLGLSIYEYARQCLKNPSFLVYRKK